VIESSKKESGGIRIDKSLIGGFFGFFISCLVGVGVLINRVDTVIEGQSNLNERFLNLQEAMNLHLRSLYHEGAGVKFKDMERELDYLKRQRRGYSHRSYDYDRNEDGE